MWASAWQADHVKTFTAAEIAEDRANFKILGAKPFVPAEIAEELRSLLTTAEIAIRTKHTPPTDWHERTKAAIASKVRCPEAQYSQSQSKGDPRGS
jgi:hypothetical protein